MNRARGLWLALGWYLLLPPWGPTPEEPATHLPLSQWTPLAAFDSAAECERAKDERVSMTADLMKKMRHNPRAERDAFAHGMRAAAAQCVATDDPRLRER